VEDKKALEEVLEKYARVCYEDRRKMEEARVERVRRDLGLITVEEEPAVEEVRQEGGRRGREEGERGERDSIILMISTHASFDSAFSKFLQLQVTQNQPCEPTREQKSNPSAIWLDCMVSLLQLDVAGTWKNSVLEIKCVLCSVDEPEADT